MKKRTYDQFNEYMPKTNRRKKLKRNDELGDSQYDDTYDKSVEGHGHSYDQYDNSYIDDDGATPAKDESQDDKKDLYTGRSSRHR
jgi:hypothetical protein